VRVRLHASASACGGGADAAQDAFGGSKLMGLAQSVARRTRGVRVRVCVCCVRVCVCVCVRVCVRASLSLSLYARAFVRASLSRYVRACVLLSFSVCACVSRGSPRKREASSNQPNKKSRRSTGLGVFA